MKPTPEMRAAAHKAWKDIVLQGKSAENATEAAITAALALLPGDPVCHLVWRQARIAADDVQDYYEVARPGDKSVDGSDPFPVFSSPAPLPVAVKADTHTLAVEIVDGVLGYNIENSGDPERQRALYGIVGDRIRSALSSPVGGTAQCCMCGKKGLSTAEGDGGSECELSDGRWVCSIDCWDKAVEPGITLPTPHSDIAALREENEALKTRNAELEKRFASADWYWPEDDTSSDACAEGPWQIAENNDVKPGEIFSYARGGVLEIRYFAYLEPALENDSDDQFEVDEPTKELAAARLSAELDRRSALSQQEERSNG